MMKENLSVREIRHADIPFLVNYWINSDKGHMVNMGVDINKIPLPGQLGANLANQIDMPIQQRNSYCIIWEMDGLPVGHSNTNPTHFGKDAFMHLHLWDNSTRAKGVGSILLALTLPLFFENLQLKDLYCQPYALNPAPNKTLEKLGFHFVKEYITVPGSLNFEQPVKLWHMGVERFSKNKKA